MTIGVFLARLGQEYYWTRHSLLAVGWKVSAPSEGFSERSSRPCRNPLLPSLVASWFSQKVQSCPVIPWFLIAVVTRNDAFETRFFQKPRAAQNKLQVFIQSGNSQNKLDFNKSCTCFLVREGCLVLVRGSSLLITECLASKE